MIASVAELGQAVALADSALSDAEDFLAAHADDGDALMAEITKLSGEVAIRADRVWARLRALLVARGSW